MSDRRLRNVYQNLIGSLERDSLVQNTTDKLRNSLQVDRVVLYYFYKEWSGQVTFESLSNLKFSIFGATGPDQCFNDKYAALYLAGRVKAIKDIAQAEITECHRNFLLDLQVRANLVVPVLNHDKLWGLLIAHHCQSPHPWSNSDIELMRAEAKNIALSPAIQNS
ncbi:GAF domain-containing protein [Oscillatoria salina]|uniref:GAF domain-containing protein n=1 Tax=Oscillatoria salina TaxID=331517 RepID=UPI0013BB0EAD|nr:GAF domain-containing protein [Oscillatoria salina]MBZ8179303.1 GAF domain-containing protein [Oscillatoria salina IIICB1]NET86729.1 GAF domain-containing protein [Kamptonema sp. SIO1D9]